MRPNKPGEWYSRDGRVVYVWGDLSVTRMNADRRVIGPCCVHDLEGDDWLPAEPPKFPELPPKPRGGLCFVHRANADWWAYVWDKGMKVLNRGYGDVWGLKDVAIVPHPYNDPEAERLIEEAQKNARQ